MKKSLLSVLSLVTMGAAFAQTPSPDWTISQNASFTVTAAGTRFLDAVSSNVVWAVGYNGLAPSQNYNWCSRTINGGTNWNVKNIVPDTNSYVLANLEGIDANTAWASAYKKPTQSQGGIFRTADGNTSWQNMTPAGMYTNTASFCNIVSFATPLIGITQGDPIGASNEYEIWRTTDGGLNWTQVPGSNIPNPTAGEFGIVNVYTKQGTGNFWFGTNSGRVYRSTDAGQTWNVATLPTAISTNAYVTDLAFTSPLVGICALNNNGTAELFNTTDGGANWTAITPLPANYGLNDISVVPGTNYLVSAGAGAGNNVISYSTDNGMTWTDWGSVSIQYLTVDFADNVSGWAGSFSDQVTASNGGIWKYSGPALNSTSVPPTAAFSLPTLLCSSSATATPVNSSTGSGPLTYSWSSSPAATISAPTASAPLFTFPGAGTYTVTLEATNSVTTNITTQVVNVTACSAPTASFAVTSSSVCNKVATNFTNTSTGSPTPTFSWTTTGSSTITPSATSSNVAISFSTAGVYTVTLWAMNAQGTVSTTQTISISNCGPVAGFNVPSGTQCTVAAITPTNTTPANSPAGGGALTYSWSCSPTAGSISNVTALNPTITLVNAGTYTITLKATNTSGTMIATQQVTVSTCIGVEENSLNASNISVYPNPAKDHLNIEIPEGFSDNYSVTLTNVLGKVILSEKVANKEKINISFASVAKGIYFVTVESKGQKANKKIIIE
ncbi:MAG: hypothetical protein K0S32_3187 [Bacteroidetes bacterium]|jgi:PKD repeat protein|nr:hypothetical protein [Bacteroidota bacterium]